LLPRRLVRAVIDIDVDVDVKQKVRDLRVET
jgi:hypothetical protein